MPSPGVQPCLPLLPPLPRPPSLRRPGKGLASLTLCFSICSDVLHSLTSEPAFRPEETDPHHPPSPHLWSLHRIRSYKLCLHEEPRRPFHWPIFVMSGREGGSRWKVKNMLLLFSLGSASAASPWDYPRISPTFESTLPDTPGRSFLLAGKLRLKWRDHFREMHPGSKGRAGSTSGLCGVHLHHSNSLPCLTNTPTPPGEDSSGSETQPPPAQGSEVEKHEVTRFLGSVMLGPGTWKPINMFLPHFYYL